MDRYHALALKRNPLVLLCILVAGLSAAGRTDPAPVRRRILIDSDWRFHLASNPNLTKPTAIKEWRWKFDDEGSTDASSVITAAPTGTGWQNVATGVDTFHGRVGYAWFETSLPDVRGPRRTVEFAGVDDNATVFLNGKQIARHGGWNDPFDVSLDEAWKPGGPNVLYLLVQNINGPGGITGAVTLGTDSTVVGGDPARADFNDRRWRRVHLPHDYVVEQKFTPTADANHGSLPSPRAWYRKTFILPASDRGRSVWIEFEGVYRDSVVYLNGRKLGEHLSGYTSFRYDIGKAARFGGKNLLAVSVNPRHYEGWWYDGGGIYRHVWLNVAYPLHVAPSGTFVTSNLSEPGADGAPAPATVSIQTTVANDSGADASCVVASRILDETGAVVATSTTPATVQAGQRRDLSQEVTVEHPNLWSLEKPTLYSLQTDITRDGKVIDATETPFGIRTIRFDPNTGFYLNGKSVKIQGVCNHQDFAGVGVAVPDSLEAYRVRRLKEMGVNGWRMSHNPPTPSLLDACDRLGMLVMDENRHLGDTYSDHTASGTPYSDLSDLADLIQRDRNHPSIIMWSMCNEEGLEGSPQGARIFSAMMDVVHKYDTTRPISCAMNAGWMGEGIATVEDLVGVNYHPEVYDQVHQKYPKKPMFGSETASTVTARGVYAEDRTNGWTSSYHLTDGSWQPVGLKEYMSGSFAWTGFDYKGEPTPFRWPDINSNFGILDMCGFPKDNYYYLQSWWTDEPVLHLMPHWNWPGFEGKNVRVVCFSNAAHVELFLNGESLGVKEMPRLGHLEWEVKYAPGTLSAKGYDAEGKQVSSTAVVTTGAPAALRLSADRLTLTADGEDVQPIKVEVLDARGNVVPTADSLVTFTVTGAGHVAGVGNGNPSDHDPDKAIYRHAFNGLCMVIVGAGEKPGAVTVAATAPGLRPASITLTTSRQPRLDRGREGQF